MTAPEPNWPGSGAHDVRGLRRFDLLRFIAGYQAHHGGISPALREIAHGLQTSKSAVHGMLVQLEREGLIRRLPKKERAIELLGRVAIPSAPDGAPLFAVPLIPRSGRVFAGATS